MGKKHERIKWSSEIVNTHAELCGNLDEDNETKLIDLLADLFHYAHKHNVDMNYVFSVSERHFFSEK